MPTIKRRVILGLNKVVQAIQLEYSDDGTVTLGVQVLLSEPNKQPRALAFEVAIANEQCQQLAKAFTHGSGRQGSAEADPQSVVKGTLGGDTGNAGSRGPGNEGGAGI